MPSNVTASNVAQMNQALDMISQTLTACRHVQSTTEQQVEDLISHWEADSQRLFRGVMENFSERCTAIRGQLDTLQNKVQETLGLQVQTEEAAQTSMSELQRLMDGVVDGGGVS
ncbi:hypothetical protein ABT160_10235 [Streptomyces sp. NPDC001941]|uniref:hypothetical protein n=1 Tax=Streptomyces sp. NPDC001941 TaxID=3154659 RepID=UPI00331948FC